MKVLLVTICGERQLSEAHARIVREFDKDRNPVEKEVYPKDAVDFEPKDYLEFYTWNDKREIILNQAKKDLAERNSKILDLQEQLDKSDYKSIRDTAKFARGLLSEEQKQEYFKSEDARQALRDKINGLRGT